MKCGIIGASGYAGGEVLRILLGHPSFEIEYFAAVSNAGEKVGQIHPQLTPIASREFEPINSSRMQSCDLLFLALPHGESSKLMDSIDPKTLVVDLGADYRLKDKNAWAKYYGGAHAGTWTYGMPEISGQREQIAASSRVANPGCYATAITLGAAPLLASGLIDGADITVVAASGTTGAGRSAQSHLLASEVGGNLVSYKFGGVHQHTPEIEERLTLVSGKGVRCSFTPILAPMPRGILATITALSTAPDSDALTRSAKNYFSGEPFIEILEERMPATAAVAGTNRVQMRFALDAHTGRAIVSVALDNLGKGAAGQAVQNANLMAGINEISGLTGLAVR